MDKTLKSIIIGAVIAIALFFIGYWVGKTKTNDHYAGVTETYKAKIDSLQVVIDTALAHLDLAYAAKQKVIYKTKIKHIEKEAANEKEHYINLDTSGRIAYFRERVRAKTAGN